MKLKLLLSIITVGLLISCKDASKQEKKSVTIDSVKLKPKEIITETETADSLKGYKIVDLISPKKIPATKELLNYLGEKIEKTETIDFNGDGILDYICQTKADSLGIGNEYWISSDYKTIKKTKCYSDGFYYRWFINLDNDPEPEMFEVIGDEDGADYIITDQNLVTGKNTTLQYINPIIIENDKKYWGYAWDIKSIIARTNGTVTELFCSLNHTIIRDGNEEYDPKHQKQMPVLFFTGHHTQESGDHDIQKAQWLTLEEIIKRTKR